MEMMHYQQMSRSSCRDSIKVLESDIQHANDLAAAIPTAEGGMRYQMKLVHNRLMPLLLYFLQWIDCSCSYSCFLPRYLNLFHVLIYKVYDGRPRMSTHGRRASIREFYAVILPSLEQLHHNLMEELESADEANHALSTGKKKKKKMMMIPGGSESDGDDECGICLDPCSRMVVPNCCHSMCINCYRDWSTRSQSCPFCRGSLRRVKSQDLWVLTCKDEVIDRETISREEVQRFYLYIRNLPRDSPDSMFLMYYEYLI